MTADRQHVLVVEIEGSPTGVRLVANALTLIPGMDAESIITDGVGANGRSDCSVVVYGEQRHATYVLDALARLLEAGDDVDARIVDWYGGAGF